MSNSKVDNLKLNNNEFDKLKSLRKKKRKDIQNGNGSWLIHHVKNVTFCEKVILTLIRKFIHSDIYDESVMNYLQPLLKS